MVRPTVYLRHTSDAAQVKPAVQQRLIFCIDSWDKAL